ncbi:MAG TPA: hypothetical protein VL501_08960, partial [Pyrinomonadaceae bacterium]|nr:hypothetical protein [Pyrinomonadaceae bacterium]
MKAKVEIRAITPTAGGTLIFVRRERGFFRPAPEESTHLMAKNGPRRFVAENQMIVALKGD